MLFKKLHLTEEEGSNLTLIMTCAVSAQVTTSTFQLKGLSGEI
jgi:hypothetical protein